MAAGYCYCLGIKSNDFFLKDNKKAFILWLNVPKVTAYDRLRMYPVKAGLNDHCGMFFLGKDKKLICDDLTIRPYTLKTLRSLCDLLQANVVFANC